MSAVEMLVAQGMSADTPANSPKLLPESRVVLETMFKHCDLCIERARNALHRGAQNVWILLDWDDGKIRWEEVVTRLQHILNAHHRERDTAATEIESLWPYCEPELLSGAAEYFDKAMLSKIESHEVNDEQSANQFVTSYVDFMLGQRLHFTALQRLRTRIVQALEADSADSGADREAFLAKIAPRNADIATLYLKIIREKRPGKSEMQIALDFTNGDRKRAANLLRGVRRYRQRLSDDRS